jgi:hypothetical protein
MASAVDYRRLAQHQRGLYFVACPPTSPAAAAELGARFREVSGGAPLAPVRVDVAMGRSLEVPRAAGGARVRA